MRERLHRAGADRGERRLRVDARRRQQGFGERRVGREGRGAVPRKPAVGGETAHERIAVRMDARRRDADENVARAHRVETGKGGSAFERADSEAREIVVAGRVHAGHLGGFPADERAARIRASARDPFDHLRRDADIQLPAREIVEEEKWLRPCTTRSFTLIATRSMPTVACSPASIAILSWCPRRRWRTRGSGP